MVKGLMVEKIEGHINGGNAEVRVCMSLVWIVDVCKCCFKQSTLTGVVKDKSMYDGTYMKLQISDYCDHPCTGAARSA